MAAAFQTSPQHKRRVHVNDRITGRQAICMLLLFELGSSLVTGGSEKAGQDSWVCVLIGLAMAVPAVLLYAKLGERCPGMDLFEMSEAAFGKVGGGIVTLLFSLYSLHLGALVTKNFTEYIQVLTLPETPQPVVAACIGLLCWLAVRRGIEVAARNAAFIAPLGTGVAGALLLLTSTFMDFGNLKPAFVSSPETLLRSGFSTFAFPFAECVLFLSVFCNVADKIPLKKIYLRGILLSGGLLCALVIGNTAVLGVPITQAMYFPSYETVSVVHLGEFLSRIEVLVSGNFMIFGLVKFMVCIYVACRGFMRLPGKKDWNILTACASATAVTVSPPLYKNTMQMFAFFKIYDSYAPFFEVVLPLAVFIKLSLRKAPSSEAKEAP